MSYQLQIHISLQVKGIIWLARGKKMVKKYQPENILSLLVDIHSKALTLQIGWLMSSKWNTLRKKNFLGGYSECKGLQPRREKMTVAKRTISTRWFWVPRLRRGMRGGNWEVNKTKKNLSFRPSKVYSKSSKILPDPIIVKNFINCKKHNWWFQ